MQKRRTRVWRNCAERANGASRSSLLVTVWISMPGADRSLGLTQSQASCGQVAMQKEADAWVTKVCRE
jgi:hypothetical protein